jgi:hypothetical protein
LRSFRWPGLPHGAYHPGDKISVGSDGPAGYAHTAAVVLAIGAVGWRCRCGLSSLRALRWPAAMVA